MVERNIVAPDFAKRYIFLVEKDDVNEAIRKSTKKFRKLLKHIPDNKINYAYAEGKWTLKQLLQHLIDAERVFAYRALWIARKDAQPLPGFDENAWALHADITNRNWNDLIAEFKSVRKSTEQLFASFGEEEMEATGTTNNHQINVTALGYMCAGHIGHHIRIIKERYLHLS